MLIAPAARHAPHHRQSFFGGGAAVLARSRLLDPQFRVLAAFPVDHEHDFARIFVDIGDDVRDQGTHKPLAGAHAHARRVPGGLEITGKTGEVGRIWRRIRRILRGQAGFTRRHPMQRRLPALLQLCGDEAIIGVAGRVAPLRKPRLVLRLLQLQRGDATAFALGLHQHPLRFQRRLDRHRLQGAPQFGGHRGVDARPAERHASRQPQHLVGLVAAIDGLSRRLARVGHPQATTAACAGEKPGQQRPSAAPRLRTVGRPIGIPGELGLVALVGGPIDVAFVVLLEQNLPLLERLAVTVALTGAAVDDRGALLAFAIDVRPRVEGVLQHRDDVAVADRPPVEGNQRLAVGRPWKVDPVRRQGQQDLSRTPESLEARENQTDHLLHTQVGIQPQTGLAVPAIADRDPDAQLATARLGAGRVEHASAQDTELEFADAALHAQKQAVVRPARIVDAIQINHPRLDQPAEFQQMMPVASVTREPGRIEADDGSDLAGAEPCNEALEAGSRHGSAGRSAEVVVDHLDVLETPAPGDIDELILTALALKVHLNLGWGRLPDIDHGLAPQHRQGQEIRRGHRHAPPSRRLQPRAAAGPAAPMPCCARLGSSPEAWRNRAPGAVGVRAGLVETASSCSS